MASTMTARVDNKSEGGLDDKIPVRLGPSRDVLRHDGRRMGPAPRRHSGSGRTVHRNNHLAIMRRSGQLPMTLS